jgi:hypothetical protein
VTFGGVPATSFSVVSSTSISAVAPSEAAGTVDIVVSRQAAPQPPAAPIGSPIARPLLPR